MARQKILKLGPVAIGNDRAFTLIAGPCIMESEEHLWNVAWSLKKITDELKIQFIFKCSYDKANRSSVHSYRGFGIEKGMKMLAALKKKFSFPVLTDVHLPQEAELAAQTADILQIPAFLSRQTDLIVACAKTGRILNIKKGQFLSPWEMQNIVEKAKAAGNDKILLTERGTSFGYHNLVVDMRSLSIMKKSGYPVVFDATHSVQLPGGRGHASGGEREFVPALSRAATAVGIASLFMEVHPDPDKALSDGPNSVKLSELKEILKPLIAIDRFVKNNLNEVKVK